MKEWAKWVSKLVNGVSGAKKGEQSKAEHCVVDEQSEWCERTNVVSDQVARSKRHCFWLETPPMCACLNLYLCPSVFLSVHLFVHPSVILRLPPPCTPLLCFIGWAIRLQILHKKKDNNEWEVQLNDSDSSMLRNSEGNCLHGWGCQSVGLSVCWLVGLTICRYVGMWVSLSVG